jgi:hypothetical protein
LGSAGRSRFSPLPLARLGSSRERERLAVSHRRSRKQLVPRVMDSLRILTGEKKMTTSDGCSQKRVSDFTVWWKWTNQIDLPLLDALVGRVVF